MKCQYCQQREAVNTFLVAYPGGQREIHLCSKCTENAQQYYYAMRRMNPGMFAGLESPEAKRQLGDTPFPDYAGEDIERRRKINQLQAKLRFAVDNERYEEAARIRDEIKEKESEKDVYTV